MAALAKATTLTHHDPTTSLRLITDASNIACAAVLEQVLEGSPHPLAFFSLKLTPPEIRYSAFDRELLAIYQAVRHFKYLLDGTPFTILTDHKPLVHRLRRWEMHGLRGSSGTWPLSPSSAAPLATSLAGRTQ